MEFNIRPAVREDCPRMMELIHELAVYEKAPKEVTVHFDHFVESGFGPHPVWWAFVAELPGASAPGGDGALTPGGDGALTTGKNIVIGFALYYIRYSTWKGQRMYLEDILVTESMRGNGVGKLLMDRLILECKEKKFSGMVWQVLEWNESAINFYKKYHADFDAEWVNCAINF